MLMTLSELVSMMLSSNGLTKTPGQVSSTPHFWSYSSVLADSWTYCKVKLQFGQTQKPPIWF